jgi:hypothetical protein
MSDITILIDDRARLVTAVLAASHWPQIEQAQLTHAVHPHAKQTQQFVQRAADHRAVTAVNNALAANTPLSHFFSAVLRTSWGSFIVREPLPASDTFNTAAWLKTLPDFGEKSGLSVFWAAHQAPWLEGITRLKSIFHDTPLPRFLVQLRHQSLNQRIAIMPNIVYPALQPVLGETAETIYLLLPPPKAVGQSPPWPYDEDPGWVLERACHALMDHYMADILSQFNANQEQLLKYAAATLFLEEAIDETEATGYLIRIQKQHNLPRLPLAVAELRHWLEQGDRDLFDLDVMREASRVDSKK